MSEMIQKKIDKINGRQHQTVNLIDKIISDMNQEVANKCFKERKEPQV